MSGTQTRFGDLILGLAPQIVGTVSQADTLARLAVGMERTCDIVEIRLDLIGPDAAPWLQQAKAIEAQGFPVVVTIRLASEGGQWTQPDAARLPLFETALEQLSAADVELVSPLLPKVSTAARRRQRALVVSHHDFVRTPSAHELRQIVLKAAEYGTVVKIATLTQTEDDVAALRGLFTEKCSVSLCVLGMGSLGPQTRLEFPKLGSCLTYGYLDVPVASGQVSARELMQQLRRP
ncbi:MAG TPA: type I 3-dehydroquinate dehydratase [Verrucomicrobiae bacterium]|nr:type I 3-dehydroquinate dehydratase [Verrucomicrobiae bacterium]